MFRLLPLLLAMAAANAAEGPYNAHFLAGGPGLEKPVAAGTRSWTLQGWVLPDEIADGRVSLAAGLALDHGHPALGSLKASASLKAGQWVWLAASSDGTTERLWLDGKQIAQGKAEETIGASLMLGGREAGAEGFGGKLAGLTVEEGALTA